MSKTLPAAYTWLRQARVPRIIEEALQLFGIEEVPGKVNAPVIMAWAEELDLVSSYVADAVPWCGLFAAIVVKRAGWTPVDAPLWARNWGKFGQPSLTPGLGDILVFQRAGGGGHVGFYVGEDAQAYHVLGGNQGDSVSIVRMAKNRMLAARRPMWKVSQPASVKPYPLAVAGGLSRNEA
ncbi:MAG: TIGR02594 family protein [Gammaproteobacteria bacterium]|nr:TIGR02594 family protein [Gammaproteobacteria bacterium]